MTSITIHDLDDALEERLRRRAARLDRSTEDGAREILISALAEESRASSNLAESVRRRFAEVDAIDRR